MARCKHSRTSWSGWTTVHGVTHDMEYRDKTCNECGTRVDRETKQGKRYENGR